MAFTISNIENVVAADRVKDSLDEINNDWKSLIDENVKRDKISMENEIIRDKKKKENYK